MNWAAIHECVNAAPQLCGGYHASRSEDGVQGDALPGLQRMDEGWVWKGHTLSPVWSPLPHERRKHIFLFSLQTEIDSPAAYLGYVGDDWQQGYIFTSWEALTPKFPTCWAQIHTRPGPVFEHLDPWPSSSLTPWGVRDGWRSVRGSILGWVEVWGSKVWHFDKRWFVLSPENILSPRETKSKTWAALICFKQFYSMNIPSVCERAHLDCIHTSDSLIRLITPYPDKPNCDFFSIYVQKVLKL